jgi:mxaA protein
VFYPRCVSPGCCAILLSMRALCNALLTLLMAALCTSLAHAATAHTALARAYGYQLGDVLTQEVSIELGAGESQASVLSQSLPKLGKQGAWLELVGRSEIARHEDASLHFSLHYQVMNVPREVAVVFLPSPLLKLGKRGAKPGDNESEVKIPAQAISIAPMTKDEAFARAGMEALRPEHEVMPEPASAYKAQAVRWMVAALLMALIALALAWWLHRLRQRGPFARAAREVRRTQEVSTAIHLLHHAFNESAGQSVFAQSLHLFFQKHAHFSGLRADIEQFFQHSRRHFFFVATDQALDLQSIKTLAQHLAQAEKLESAGTS